MPSKSGTTDEVSDDGRDLRRNLVNEAMIQLKARPEDIIKDDIVQKFLIAAALQAPEYTLPELYVFLAAPNLSVSIRKSRASRPQNAETKQAEFLLKDYPNVSRNLRTLYENRNETLLRLAMQRVTLACPSTPAFSMEAAQILKKKALAGFSFYNR